MHGVSCRGQTFTEYALIAALVLVVSATALMTLGTNLRDSFSEMLPARETNQAMSLSSGGAGNINGAPAASSGKSAPYVLNPKTIEVLRNAPKGTGSEVVQAVGSLGGADIVAAYTDVLNKVAQKYAETDPELYNALVELGSKGKDVAKDMAECSSQCMEQGAYSVETEIITTERQKLIDTIENFLLFYDEQVYHSGIYQNLSAEDRQLVTAMTKQSGILAATVARTDFNRAWGINYVGASMPIDTSVMRVEQNSDATIHCGTQGSC